MPIVYERCIFLTWIILPFSWWLLPLQVHRCAFISGTITPLFHGAVEKHSPDLELKEMMHFPLCTEIKQEDMRKASKCLSMQWEKYWNKIEFPRFRPVLMALQIDIRPFKELRTAARKSISLFKGKDRNSDRCFDIFLKINGSLPDQAGFVTVTHWQKSSE